ncbi:MAG: hypothetical protein KJO96_02665 [Winogradskyella sp.]|nr:hypothetical protein [Winogradskyella sp.]
MKKGNLKHIKSSGFKVPKGYFTHVEAKILASTRNPSVLNEPKTNPFKTPNSYFSNLNDQILQKLETEDHANKPKVVNLQSRSSMYYIASIAASLLLFLAVLMNKTNTEELSVDMVENYLVQQDLSSYELAELLADANLLSDDFTIVETNYNEEQLETYLMDNVDIEEIIEQ